MNTEDLKNKKSKYANYLIIALTVLFLYTGMKSCSRGREVNRLEKRIEMVTQQKDSLITELKDSVKTLNNEIQVLVTRNKGFEETLNIQQEAINQSTAAKKNIHVTVKNK